MSFEEDRKIQMDIYIYIQGDKDSFDPHHKRTFCHYSLLLIVTISVALSCTRSVHKPMDATQFKGNRCIFLL